MVFSQLLSPGGRADPVPAAGPGCGGRDGGRPPERDRARLGRGYRRREEAAKVHQSDILRAATSHSGVQNFQEGEADCKRLPTDQKGGHTIKDELQKQYNP